jgi:hypothetical protein
MTERNRASRARIVAAGALTCLCALIWTSCGNTLQDQPIARSWLEALEIVHGYPVYWLGGTFERLSITAVEHDPGGAYAIRYGDCTVGGQMTCVTPLLIVTSPDNSFVPGGAAPGHDVAVRGIRGRRLQEGRTILLATGGVVVDVYAQTPALARAAVETMVPINEPAAPGDPLPAPLPTTPMAREPLAGQTPPSTPTLSLLEAARPRSRGVRRVTRQRGRGVRGATPPPRAGGRRSSSALPRTAAPRRR